MKSDTDRHRKMCTKKVEQHVFSGKQDERYDENAKIFADKAQKKLHLWRDFLNNSRAGVKIVQNNGRCFGILMQKHRKIKMFFWKNNKKWACLCIQCANGGMACSLL